jgi:hypothetical protein
MRCPGGVADIAYRIGEANGLLLLTRDGMQSLAASDPGELLFFFDRDLSTQLQRRRDDLYFIHAAVLECTRKVVMLVAPSGGGKSTLAWALVHHGFHYLSDELAPVDLTTLTVLPYPRALLLKHTPPQPYDLPARTIRSSRGFHIVSGALNSNLTPVRISAIFFLRQTPGVSTPTVRKISTAQAATRLYASTLNALAHPGDGLDGAIHLASNTACFELALRDLSPACALLKATAERLIPPRSLPQPSARRPRVSSPVTS